MNSVISQQNYFQKHLDGDKDALMHLIDGEIAVLFDYMFRMTGRIDEVIDGIHTLKYEFVGKNKKWISYTAFRKSLFVEGKRAVGEIWNAETKNLENATIKRILDDENSAQSDLIQAEKQFRLDRIIANLNPTTREAVLLNCCYKFSIEDTAEILDESNGVVVTEVSAVITKIEASDLSKNGSGRLALQEIVFHQIPSNSSVEITDLNELMMGIKKKVPRSTWRNVFVVVFLVIAFLAYVYFMKQPKMVYDWLRQFL